MSELNQREGDPMMYIKTNLPGWERAIRIAMGVMVAGLAYLYAPSAVMAWLGIAMGVMFAGTGFIGFCPMCAMVGRRYIGTGK
jgi:Inner membrane protein YgaP-like, transmembrane domain